MNAFANLIPKQTQQQSGGTQAYLANTRMVESGGNDSAINPQSGAAGRYQFIPSTAKQYGIDPLDPVQAEDGMKRFTADNAKVLSSTLGREPSPSELYLAHQQGATGATKLLGNPTALAEDLVGKKKVTQNGGTLGMSAADFSQHVMGLYDKKAGGAASPPSQPEITQITQERTIPVADAAQVKRTNPFANLIPQQQAPLPEAPPFEPMAAEEPQPRRKLQAPPAGPAVAPNQHSDAYNMTMRPVKGFASGVAGAIPDLATLPMRMAGEAEPVVSSALAQIGIDPRMTKALMNSFSPGSDVIAQSPTATEQTRGALDQLAPTDAPQTFGGFFGDIGATTLGNMAVPLGVTTKGISAGVSPLSKLARRAAPVEASALSKLATETGPPPPPPPGAAPPPMPPVAPVQAPPVAASPSIPTTAVAPLKASAQQRIKLTPEQRAGRDLLKETLGDADVSAVPAKLTEARAAGQPMVAADLLANERGGVLLSGKNVLGMLRALASLPGKTAEIAGTVAQRSGLASQRIGQALDKFISKNDYYGSIAKAEEFKKGSNPFYQSAFKANQTIESPIVNRILVTPSGKSALKEVAHDMGDEMTLLSKPDPELMQQAKDVGLLIKGGKGVGNGLKLQTLDRVKQKLDDLARQAYQSGDRSAGRRYSRLAKGLRDELDSLDVTAKSGPNSRKPEGGDYARGRALNATGQQINEALEMGRDFMKMDPEEITAFMNNKNTSLPQKEAFAKGVRRDLQDKIDRLSDNRTPLNTVWKEGVRQRIKALGGAEKDFKEFTRFMENEKAMNRTDNLLSSGSMTNPNANYQSLLSPKKADAGSMLKIVTNPSGAAIDFGVDMLDQALQRRITKSSQETGTEVMRHLLADDPKVWEEFSKSYKPKKEK